MTDVNPAATGAQVMDVFGFAANVVQFDGGTYYVPQYAAHRPMARRITEHRYSEPPLHDLVRRVFDAWPGTAMVHAGTFFGDMLVSFSRSAAQLFAFEPVVENYLMAWQTVQTNKLENVCLLNAALAAQTGVASILTAGEAGEHRGGSSKIVESVVAGQTSQQVSTLAIDGLGLTDLALLQLDVEGSELVALQGAEQTITAQRPAIVVEDNRRNCADFLRDHGYEAYAEVAHNRLWLTAERAAVLGY